MIAASVDRLMASSTIKTCQRSEHRYWGWSWTRLILNWAAQNVFQGRCLGSWVKQYNVPGRTIAVGLFLSVRDPSLSTIKDVLWRQPKADTGEGVRGAG